MTRAMHRILLVEDDDAIRGVLTMLFETNGFRVVSADSCGLAIRAARSHRPDLCVVDLGLPDHDGLTFIRQIRSWSPVPIVVLTARTGDADRLAAFDAGADDYVIKPFGGPELLARVRAIMRRAARSSQPAAVLKLGDITIDLARRLARGSLGQEVKLTPLEHRILECLVRHADGVVTHAQIMKEVWGPHQADVRSLRVYVTSLRRKLERDPAQPRHLLTETGIGYRLATDAQQGDAAFAGGAPS